MNNRNKFRLLVISTNLGYVVSVLLFAFLNLGRLEAAYAALPEEPSSENVIIALLSSELFILCLGLAWVVSVVGLLLFKNWGRTLTAFGFLLSIPCLAFTSPAIELGIESALNELLAVCYGIILACMYLPPIASEFNRAQ